MRALPVVVAFLAVAAVAGAAVGPPSDGTEAPAVSPSNETAVGAHGNETGIGENETGVGENQTGVGANETIHVLDLQRNVSSRDTIRSASVGLGPGVEMAANETTYRLSTLAAIERIETADTPSERQRRILEELNTIEQRAIGLKNEQRAAFAAYVSGDIEARELLFALARLDAEARSLEARRERIAGLAEETPDFSIDPSRLTSLERELDVYTGPVREHAGDVLRGRAPATRFYVRATSGGVVLSTIVGGEYLRESYRSGLRDFSGTRISPETALAIAEEAYPNVWLTRRDTAVVGSGQSYLVQMSYERGELSAFVASGTRKVFKDAHRRPLTTIDTAPTVFRTRDGLTMAINRSYPGGPMQIRLTETGSDAPVNANVTVGLAGEESVLVGRTGRDGELWTLTPGGRFSVTAIRGNSVVFATADPTETPRIYSSRTENETSEGTTTD